MGRPSSPARRLEDRIRELCARVGTAKDGQLDEVTGELRLALTEYLRRVQNQASATVLAWPEFPPERRRA